MPRILAAPLMAAYLVLLFYLTLVFYVHPGSPVNLVPFRTILHDLTAGGRDFVVNFLGNLAATVPVGLLLPSLIRCDARRVLVASFGLSLLIELIQGTTGIRYADVDDLILNTLGGLIGYGLERGARQGRRWRVFVPREELPTAGPSRTIDHRDRSGSGSRD
jgi:glycopeptide antibiotics resistance protein